MKIFLSSPIELYPEYQRLSQQVLVYADSYLSENQLRAALRKERTSEINLFSNKANLSWLALYDTYLNLSINAEGYEQADLLASDKIIVLSNNELLIEELKQIAFSYNKAFGVHRFNSAKVAEKFKTHLLANVA